MPTNRPRPRRHSLSSGDESFYPHPAKTDGLPRLDSRRRARLPRSKSTSNVFDTYSRGPGTTDRDRGNIAFEQTDIATLRELAEFLRTTGPPPGRAVAHDECLRFSGSGESRRWSLQQLRRNKRTKPQRYSSQSPLPDNVIPGTTANGHRYMAIPTPTPNNIIVDGPWCRSQYPVFLPDPRSYPPRPHSSPKPWPERSSSKATPFSNAEKGAASSDMKNSPRSSVQPIEKDHSPRPRIPERSRSRTLSNRISTDHLLRAMLNPADGEAEQDIGASLKALGFQKVPGMEQMQLQTLPLMAVHEESEHSDAPPKSARGRTGPPTKPSQNENRKQSPSVSSGNSELPRSPGRSPRPLANILVQGGLAVPKDSVPPESPGFPNMLAKMTFPAPPKGSRPSSPASTAPSVADSQTSTGFRPAVQPRTSSRRACASTSVSAASLDEIVMQKRPSPRRVNSDRPVYVATTLDSSPTTVSLLESSAPTATTEALASSEDAILDGAPPKPTSRPSSTKSLCEEPTCLSSDRGEKPQRVSLASQATATTESSQQSILSRSSARSSSASELSAPSELTTTAQKADPKAVHNSGYTDPAISSQGANAEDVEFTAPGTDGDGVGPADRGNPDLDKKPEEPRRPRLWLSTTSDPNAEDNPKPKSILERRLARKAKVREYKMRDLDASRVDVVDSPILGYFAPNLPPGQDSPLHGASAPINSLRRPSTLSVATTISEASNEPPNGADDKPSAGLHDEPALSGDPAQVEAAMDLPQTPVVQLKLSAVLSTNIEPIYPKTADWHTSGITMSPIMVVADVESRPGSPTLRFSTLARPESASPRTMGRLKPLKISPHARQKSHTVTISRNPSTGVIERSASGPLDYKLNRRSLMAMPTPPMSPEATQLSKRLSLPPVQLSLPLTDRTPPFRRQDWYSSYMEERGPENRLRSATLKERVMREKLQKEKEITDIVAKTVGLPQKQIAHDPDPESLPLEPNNTETLEKRLDRLERNNDAWLSAMKPLLETMARTLEEMRADDRCSSLRMSDFVIDMEAEAKRVTHSRRGEKETTSATQQSLGGIGSGGLKLKNALAAFSSTPLSPVPQELDDSAASDDRTPPVALEDNGPADKKTAASITPHDIVGSSSPQDLEARASEAIQRGLLQQRSMMQEISKTWGASSLASPSTTAPPSSDKTAIPAEGGIPNTQTGIVGAEKVEQSRDLPDLGPLVQELGNMPRKSWEEREQRKGDVTMPRAPNALNPLMHELMSASRLCAEGIINTR
ncbi:hypothetical protein SAMD00023353_4700940 [Rosellinia necatrix]|uniref:Uncharacterized protein n=1 Tax=Rosellinia necatrix TaxID=77044 RepID=A0A1W2TQS9_ROSNE|nr:hypothetical protein SAMD00023353_4700940 [Rosellinia necatrix]